MPRRSQSKASQVQNHVEGPGLQRARKSTRQAKGQTSAPDAPELVEDSALQGEEDDLLPSRKGLLQSAGIVFIIITHVLAFMAGYYLPPPQRGASADAVSQKESQGLSLPQAVHNMGEVAVSYLDARQAKEMLALMARQPGRKIYELRFSRAGRRVTVTADLANQMLTRTRVLPDGSGNTTFWEGDILERLQDAAANGSFDFAEGERPSGKTTQFAAGFVPGGGKN